MQRTQKTFALKAGSIEGNHLKGDAGYAGVLDSYDDVIFPGAFGPEVLADFLSHGFVADSHDWDKLVAMPLVAEERGAALYTEAEFHSTPDAQAIRTKCVERLDKDLSVGLSIGFGMLPTSYKVFPSGEALLAHARTNGCEMRLFDEAGILACNRRCRAILKVDKLYEYSVVSVAANPRAQATEAKRAVWTEGALIKSEHLGYWAEADAAEAALSQLSSRLMWYAVLPCLEDDETPTAERLEKLTAAFDEFRDLSLAVVAALLSAADPETLTEAKTYLRNFTSDPEIPNALPAGTFARSLETALAAVNGATARATALAALRAKDGRTLSDAGREKIAAQKTALTDCLSAIDTVLAASAPRAEEAATLALRAKILQRQARQRTLLAGVTPT